MTTRYAVGRLNNGGFDLEDCDLHPLLSSAARDLIERCSCQDLGNASHLVLLCCKVDDSNDVLNAEPVSTGQLVETLLKEKLLSAP